ncbi:MAG: phosphoribosylamine--glycine ligase [Paludibacteraceae bacterium]|jgi:phosphoribosylamine--glycine ligase|nr:phosphoribosylamine--glycine ligase [Paludibacteraceae bacterium]MDI9537283.1 phosphoribosylamine--glycine ligase [Bacteroidota bacterium]HHT61070.1 phosphoribosylamine--glycine ligase [Bacteroidales bacterium]MBP9039585.1 phosphoribosylamine--glycine ligase [Paludibacteraceae bacterium]HOH71367.1 phosphoribosylamine--glycine ligase [Paludibacteraceae bacterium]
MKVLVIGGGGREHAIIDAISKSKQVTKIYAAPGNAGIAQLAECLPIKDTDVDTLVTFAYNHAIDLTVVGPELALAAGIVDAFEAHGLRIFGPTKAATQIESSKQFAKDLMKKYDIPTADYKVFSDYSSAWEYVQTSPMPVVLKYDGLAAGKGVVIAENLDEANSALKDMLQNDKFGHGQVVIEEFMTGPEFSFMCFVSGDKVYPMVLSQDHKRAFDGDKGPNTGGMGAYSPLPFITKADEEFALQKIMLPTAKAMIAEGCPFKGVLYGGLMKTPNGIKVVEFNARFGDPETEVVLPRLTADIVDIFTAIIDGTTPVLTWDKRAAIGIVLASKGYPNNYEKGFEIKNLDRVDTTVYHMGTKRENDKIITNGGRVLFVTALADTLKEAREKANAEVAKIDCENLFYRTDIGWQAT